VPPFSLRTRLVFVVIACVLPLAVLNLGIQFFNYRASRTTAEQRTLELARGLSLALDQEFRARIALLQVLALSRRLQDGDIDGFRSRAETLVSQHLQPNTAIILLRDDGQQVMNTNLPRGAALPVRRNLDTIQQVIATEQPVVSGVFGASTDGHAVVTIEVPVLRLGGGVAYVLALSPPLTVFAEIIRRQQISDGWVVALLDAQGIVVARVPGEFVGQSAAPGFLARVLTETEGLVETVSLEGIPVLSAFSHTEAFGWSAGVAVPRAMLTAQPWRVALATLAAGLILLLAGLFLAGAMARRITGPIAALCRLAAAVDGELPIEPLADALPETSEVAAALAGAARERHLALEAGAVGIFQWDVRAGQLRWDLRMRAIWAVPICRQISQRFTPASIQRTGLMSRRCSLRPSILREVAPSLRNTVWWASPTASSAPSPHAAKSTLMRLDPCNCLGQSSISPTAAPLRNGKPCWHVRWIIVPKMCWRCCNPSFA
jgi:hypothetical protein